MAHDANFGPILIGFCNVPLAATFSAPALSVRKDSKIWSGRLKSRFFSKSENLSVGVFKLEDAQCESEICSYDVLKEVLCVGGYTQLLTLDLMIGETLLLQFRIWHCSAEA